MADSLRTRQGVHNLSDADVSAFRDAYGQMQTITDNRGFAYFAGLHGVPNWLCKHSTANAPAYLFLPWHRAYLYNFELAMRSRVPSISLPWWDWTLRPPRQAGIPQIFADRTASGKPNPLYSFRIDLTKPSVHHTTTRQPGSVDDLPTQQNVVDVSSTGDWSEFTLALEDQLHNAGSRLGRRRHGHCCGRRLRSDILLASLHDRSIVVAVAGAQRKRQHAG